MRARERYQEQIKEKQKQMPNLRAETYKVCMEKDLLESMVLFCELDHIAKDVTAENFTSSHINAYLERILEQNQTSPNSTAIQKALKGIRVDMSITQPSARMLQYAAHFIKRLKYA